MMQPLNSIQRFKKRGWDGGIPWDRYKWSSVTVKVLRITCVTATGTTTLFSIISYFTYINNSCKTDLQWHEFVPRRETLSHFRTGSWQVTWCIRSYSVSTKDYLKKQFSVIQVRQLVMEWNMLEHSADHCLNTTIQPSSFFNFASTPHLF